MVAGQGVGGADHRSISSGQVEGDELAGVKVEGVQPGEVTVPEVTARVEGADVGQDIPRAGILGVGDVDQIESAGVEAVGRLADQEPGVGARGRLWHARRRCPQRLDRQGRVVGRHLTLEAWEGWEG